MRLLPVYHFLLTPFLLLASSISLLINALSLSFFPLVATTGHRNSLRQRRPCRANDCARQLNELCWKQPSMHLHMRRRRLWIGYMQRRRMANWTGTSWIRMCCTLGRGGAAFIRHLFLLSTTRTFDFPTPFRVAHTCKTTTPCFGHRLKREISATLPAFHDQLLQLSHEALQLRTELDAKVRDTYLSICICMCDMGGNFLRGL